MKVTGNVGHLRYDHVKRRQQSGSLETARHRFGARDYAKGHQTAVALLNPKISMGLLIETAKTQALAGAAAGAAIGILRSVVSIRRNRFQSGYDVLAEGMTEIGVGTVLGILSSVAATATGVTVAAISGRAVLIVAAPLVASAVTSSLAHNRVDSVVRPMTEDFVNGLKRASKENFLVAEAKQRLAS